MPKIDNLILEHCPEGVAYKPLGDVCEFITDYVANGSFASIKENVKYVSVDEGYARLIRTADFSNNFDQNKAMYVTENAYKFLKKSKLEPNQIVICNVGSVGLVFRAPFLDMPMTLAPNAITLVTKYNDDFYHHYLKSEAFQKKIQRIVGKSAMPKFNKTQLRTILVPVPPIEVQKEIAETLDKFTQLEAELSAELDARRKQYEYYRNQLLTFDESRADVRRLTLGDVATIKSGKNKNRKPEAEYPVFGSTGIIGYSDKYAYEGEVLLVARVGAYAGQVNRVNGRYDVSDNTLMIKLVDSCSYDYFYHLLVNMDLNQYASGGGQPLVTAGKLKELRIPVPELNEQNDIAEILGKFHKLTNDISEGLPAEINARRQQYEYYRTKLLTFQELTA